MCPVPWPTRLKIAKRCNLYVGLGQAPVAQLPHAHHRWQADAHRGLFPVCRRAEGLEERLVHLYPDPAKREAERPRYAERLEFEINTILKMGFPGYFLIVGDFINWAKNNGCPVGPGSWFRCRLSGGLFLEDHRPRSAAIQLAVRTFLEP
jgi:DNA polymerase-3 subunit alpha